MCAFFISPDSEHFQTPECCLTLWGEGRSVLRGRGLEDSGTLKSTSWSISAVCRDDVIMMTNENDEEGQQKVVPKCEVAFPVKSQSSICHNRKLWRASERASEEEKKDKGCYDLCVWFDELHSVHFSVVFTICHQAILSFIYFSLMFESLLD